MSSRWSTLGLAAVVVVCAATETVWAGPGPCSCNADVSNVGGVGVNIIDVVTTADCARIGSCGGCVNSCDVDCDGDVDYYDAGVVSCAFQGQSNCCTEPDGACTGANNSTPPCVLTTDNFCDVHSGTYHGDNTICMGNNVVAVPAASNWGMLSLALGTLIAATIVLRRGAKSRGVAM